MSIHSIQLDHLNFILIKKSNLYSIHLNEMQNIKETYNEQTQQFAHASVSASSLKGVETANLFDKQIQLYKTVLSIFKVIFEFAKFKCEFQKLEGVCQGLINEIMSDDNLDEECQATLRDKAYAVYRQLSNISVHCDLEIYMGMEVCSGFINNSELMQWVYKHLSEDDKPLIDWFKISFADGNINSAMKQLQIKLFPDLSSEESELATKQIINILTDAFESSNATQTLPQKVSESSIATLSLLSSPESVKENMKPDKNHGSELVQQKSKAQKNMPAGDGENDHKGKTEVNPLQQPKF